MKFDRRTLSGWPCDKLNLSKQDGCPMFAVAYMGRESRGEAPNLVF
jgi:hypothetical protein